LSFFLKNALKPLFEALQHSASEPRTRDFETIKPRGGGGFRLTPRVHEVRAP